MSLNSAVRLACGVRLTRRVYKRGGSDKDMQLVCEQGCEQGERLFDSFADQFMECVRYIKGDANSFRLVDDEVVFVIPALKRPSLEDLKKDWSSIRSIESDYSTEEEVVFRLATVLKSEEERIDGVTYERRIAKLRTDGKILGFQHRAWLLKHQDDAQAIPDSHVRAALRALLGNIYIDFSEVIVVDDDGARRVPCAGSGGKRWNGYWRCVSSGFSRCRRFAVVGK